MEKNAMRLGHVAKLLVFCLLCSTMLCVGGVSATYFTDDNNDTTVTLPEGATFYVGLWENPSTGDLWKLTVSDGLKITSSEFYPNPHREQGSDGVGGTRMWTIEASKSGDQDITGVLKQTGWIFTSERRYSLHIHVVPFLKK